MTSLSKTEARHLLSLLKRIEKDLTDLAHLRQLLETKNLIDNSDRAGLPAGWIEKIAKKEEDIEFVH